MNQIWEEEILDIVILEMLREKGFYKVNQHALRMLRDILINKSEEIMCQAKQLSENSQRNEVNLFDVLNVIEKDDQYLYELTKRLELTQNKHQNTNDILSKLDLQDDLNNDVKCLTKNTLDNGNNGHLIEDDDIKYIPYVQQDYIQSQYPCGFVRSNKDNEKPLYISLPDPLDVQQTKEFDQQQITNIDIKNKRTEEMRNFELENCKVQAIDKKTGIQNEEETITEKEIILKNYKDNQFSKEAKEIDNFDIFEIGNSQMFQLISYYQQTWKQNQKFKIIKRNKRMRFVLCQRRNIFQVNIMVIQQEKFFPFEKIFEWLQVFHQPHEMIRREISYIIGNDMSIDEEYVIRNMSYRSAKEFKNAVLKMIPLRIDIGAYYSADVGQNKNKVKDLHIKPLEREFVIDIDMNDYDHIRTCCKGKKLCKKCWTYVKAAYYVLKVILQDAFDFNNILWVFSGRRGLHAWVCDREAKIMDKKLRSSVTEFLNFTISNENVNYLVKKELIDRTDTYPTLQKAYNILKQYKDFLIKEQKILDRKNTWDKLCEVVSRYTNQQIPNKDQAFNIQDQDKKFKFLLDQIEFYTQKQINESDDQKLKDNMNNIITKQIEKFNMEFIVGFLYPKIDSNVSAQVNHLLKCPFNIHHDSMKVSLPIANMDNFDIDSCVGVQKLIGKTDKEKGPREFHKALKHFENFVEKLQKEENIDFQIINNNMSIKTEFSELDEPVMTTIKRDLLSFVTKIRYVLFPFSNQQKVNELRNWDLFGPLLISVILTVLMILKGKISNSDAIIAANFLILFAGSLIVTLNAKLCGVQYSLFFYVSVLGYCLAPFLLAATANLFLGFILTRFFILLITIICYLWALRSCSMFFSLTIRQSRKNMVLYPVCLYYLFFGWFIVLEQLIKKYINQLKKKHNIIFINSQNLQYQKFINLCYFSFYIFFRVYLD